MTNYSHVPAIVDALLAEGLTPSADRVRSRLGSGSNQTIQAEIRKHLRTLGRLPEEDQEPPRPLALIAGHTPPEPDQSEVAGHLERLRQATNDPATASHLQAWLAVTRCLPEPLQRTVQRLNRDHARTQAGLSFARLTNAPHRHAAMVLLEGLAPLMEAAETFLQQVTFDGTEEATDGYPKRAA